MTDLGELGSKGSGVSKFSDWVSKEYVFSYITEGVGEYVLNELLEGEYGVPSKKNRKVGLVHSTRDFPMVW